MENKETLFRGFEIAESKIERSTAKCKDCVQNSCGVRDCLLQVYDIDGKEKMISGGICPKGNTHPLSKKAPNYTSQYRALLNAHLSKYSVNLESLLDDNNTRVLIPRSLTFLNERGVFYTSLYSKLGFNVSVSNYSNESTSQSGKKFAHSESCFPFILAHGHVAELSKYLRLDKDKLLLVNMGREVKGEDRLAFCPYASSAGYVLKGNFKLSSNNVLMPDLFFNDPNHKTAKYVHSDLQRVFKNKFSLKQVEKAVDFAFQKNADFISEVHKKGSEIFKKLIDSGENIYLGIARGYTLFDPKASSEVDELFANQGLHFLPSHFLDIPEHDISKIASNMYWVNGRKMIQVTLETTQKEKVFPIRLTNFNCGPDSILLIHEEGMIKKSGKPHLVLETDGHNSNAQFGTRIAANNEVVKNSVYNHIEPKCFHVDYPNVKKLSDRKIGVPYMGDTSHCLSAAFKAAGIESEVMPTHTQSSINIAKKLVSTNVCLPFAFQVGEHVAWLNSLKDKGENPNEMAATFMPKSIGPCRFGQYSVLLRKIFNENGFSGVPVFDPIDRSDYDVDIFSKSEKKILYPLFFKGTVAVDILTNALLRVRPYEINTGESDSVFNQSLSNLSKYMIKNPNFREVKKLMDGFANSFKSIPINKERKPIVLLSGEVYVRNNENSNQNSIRLLENHGLEVVIDSGLSWINYINRGLIRDAVKENKFKELPKLLLKRGFINWTTNYFSAPFKQLIKGRESHNPYQVMDSLEEKKIYSFVTNKGESCASIATAYEFLNGKTHYDGIYHVAPFGCMQETVAISRVQSLIQDYREKNKDIIPYMDAVFGESELSNLNAEIALFAEKCRIRKAIKK